MNLIYDGKYFVWFTTADEGNKNRTTTPTNKGGYPEFQSNPLKLGLIVPGKSRSSGLRVPEFTTSYWLCTRPSVGGIIPLKYTGF